MKDTHIPPHPHPPTPQKKEKKEDGHLEVVWWMLLNNLRDFIHIKSYCFLGLKILLIDMFEGKVPVSL